ncbi:hypothetical protein [Rhodopirellula baltica]|uniref:hypothetical protein n=1 Tax=Rhodopirellula baltica TaxID=265606 RepID=UPI0011817ED0|nr:hypothetical protein [Rhodopirellula baltica]
MIDDGQFPIGGYLELELPDKRQFPYPDSARFQSGRAAFLALVRSGKPDRVWMPRYICGAMLSPLESANIECVWYNINEHLAVENSTSIGPNDWLLYVNYFGVCDSNVEELLKRFPPGQVVLDYSQSFFASPADGALATIYSPRKFFGIPDGGLLISHVPVERPETCDTDSFGRISHLMRRLGDSPEAGYAAYQEAEDSLANCEPKRMSHLTQSMLSSIDLDNVSRKRKQNFLFLHERLKEYNQLSVDASNITAPLCYPFLPVDGDLLRQRLIEKRIFVASYWPDALARVSNEWAEHLAKMLLPLPIDQRYGKKEMERVVSVLLRENA